MEKIREFSKSLEKLRNLGGFALSHLKLSSLFYWTKHKDIE